MPAKYCNRLSFERELWKCGLTRVAGVDEAGRGPLAGLVVALADHPNVQLNYYRKGLEACAANIH